MAERSMDNSGASVVASVAVQSESSDPLLMEELFNYLRGISSKLDTALRRLDVMEGQNETREKQNLEILKYIKSCSKNEATAAPPTDGQVFTSCEDLRKTGGLADSDSLSEVITGLRNLPGHSRSSLTTSSLEMQHETTPRRTANNASDPVKHEIKSPQDERSELKVVEMISQSTQTEKTEMTPETNPTQFAATATKGVGRFTVNRNEEVHIRNEELVSSVKATIRAELIWLANQVDDSMSNITKTLNGIGADVSKLSTNVVAGFSKLEADVTVSVQKMAESLDNRIVERLSKTDTEMADGFVSLRANMGTTQKQLEENIFMRVDRAVDEIKEVSYRAKREMFAVVEKEAQLIRDKRAGPWPPWPMFTSYCFDFYVEDVVYFMKTGKAAYSFPWQINQFKSCVVGKVQFLRDKMEVCMAYGRDPRRVGFRPNFSTSQINVTVAASIIAYQEDHQDLVVGPEKTWSLNEEMVDSEEKEIKLGEAPCEDLLSLSYARHENNSILVRYVVKPA